jgi:hypothetical protein
MLIFGIAVSMMLTRTNCVEHGIGAVDTCEYDGSIGHSYCTGLVGTCEDDGSTGHSTVQDWLVHVSMTVVLGTVLYRIGWYM